MSNGDLNWIANYIWGIADDVLRDLRFVIEHDGDSEYSLITRSSDGQMLFLANKLSKMKPAGSRIAEVHNGSSPVHRRRRPGREQHPPLDHRERLAGGDRRPAAQHVLQHRHRHLRLGAELSVCSEPFCSPPLPPKLPARLSDSQASQPLLQLIYPLLGHARILSAPARGWTNIETWLPLAPSQPSES